MLDISKDESDLEPAIGSLNLGFIEDLYAQLLARSKLGLGRLAAVFQAVGQRQHDATAPTGPSFRPSSVFNPPGSEQHDGAAASVRELEMALLQDRVDQLVRAYRVRGHMVANIDPLGMPRPHLPELDPEFYGFTEADMDRPFSTDTIHGPDVLTLRRILERLRNTYCRSIGVQFMHIDDLQRAAMAARPHGRDREPPARSAKQEQLRILTRLTDAAIFEEFIQKKFIGAKSFSLEGAESLIPLLDLAIEKAGDQGIREIVLGMAHRGRLNVLANIMGKSPQEIFREFADIDPKLHLGRGDVKYHLGYSSDWIDRRAAEGPPLAVLQPQPPGIRQPGGPGPRAGQAGPRRAITKREHGHGAADPRRRGVRRRRHRAGDAQPQPARRLHDRRHDPRRRQQPDRLHHVAGRGPFEHLRHRRGEDAANSRSSTSTAKTPRPWPRSCGWRWISATSSSATW